MKLIRGYALVQLSEASVKLVDEIIDGAVDGKTPVPDVLRKCLVLAFQLKNDRLKESVQKRGG
jgi:hypothetical protein